MSSSSRTILPCNPRWFSLLALLSLAGRPAIALTENRPLLSSVREIRALPPDQAKLRYPLRVKGVVTTPSGWKTSFFFQDATAGISVDRESNGPPVKSGQLVEIVGVTGPGLFAPVILAGEVRVLGPGALPPAPRLLSEHLADGSQDSQWVELRGTVHSATIQPDWGRPVLFLGVAVGGTEVVARVIEFPDASPAALVDADVTIRGVCATNFNRKRQFIGVRVFVPSLEYVRIDVPAPGSPFDAPARTMDSVLKFRPGGTLLHRVKIRGTVTYHQPGSVLYLQDGNQSIRVHASQTLEMHPGDRVEAAGFASAGEYSPELRDAVFRLLGPGEPVVPIDLNPAQMIGVSDGFRDAPYDGMLVRLRAQLVERQWHGDEHSLVLRSGGVVFDARLDGPRDLASASGLRSGSTLQVTGICKIDVDQNREPHSFSILLRAPADLVVLAEPAWWTVKHALWGLGIAVLSVFAALGWAASLQRRVNARTADLTRTNTELARQMEQRRLLESQLMLAQKLEAVGQLAAGIAHEINTPLQYACDNNRFLGESFGALNQVLSACVDILPAMLDSPALNSRATRLESLVEEADIAYLSAEIPRAVEQSADGLARIANIVSAMKEFSHPDSMTKTSVDLNRAVENTLLVCRNEWAHVADAVTGLDPSLPAVECLPGLINQVILNLVVNAAHAIGERNDGSRGSINVSTRQDGHWAELRVSDNGMGMSEEVQRKIFTPFLTTNPVGKGTGQGLFLSRTIIVKKHGGEISFETQRNLGTTFVVRLPIEAAVTD